MQFKLINEHNCTKSPHLDFRKICMRCGLCMLLSLSFSFQSRATNQTPECKPVNEETLIIYIEYKL